MAVLIWLGFAVICIAKAMQEYGEEKVKEEVEFKEEEFLYQHR